ncbi:hypothetical protein SSPO_062630 [Streptomyces antimycoticus]|uniref:Amidase domain-containing protein n=1 Tax=Streptomyces antimycoticus TaxID=68175 RepID=A0A499UNB8_9ACTN|nr:hypothetical protein SSPO_062630 [Streptomyces antimycoticus]
MTDMHNLTAVQLIERYASGELSPVEATRAVLHRIEQIQPEVNAFSRVDAEGALRQAEESAERWRRGTPRAWWTAFRCR